jgi:formylglycine-generating enzyme required for sulfatase activity
MSTSERMLWIATLLVMLPSVVLARGRPIVAVFDIENRRSPLKRDAVDGLCEYLTAHLAESGGFDVVPRDQVRTRLIAQKRDTYKECYAQSCQIEIGQALAADKTLSTVILRIGSACEVTSTLFDLKRETTDTAATAEAICDEDGIKTALKTIVLKLASRVGGTPGPALEVGAPRETPTGAVSEVKTPARVESVGTASSRTGNLTVYAPVPMGVAVRIELVDPEGRIIASGSRYSDPEAPVGAWKATVLAPGFDEASRSFEVRPGSSTVIRFDLKKAGGLRVTGEPDNARVTITGPSDYRAVGNLPLEVADLKTGKYRVDVAMPGYRSESRTASVEQGRTALVAVRLAKESPTQVDQGTDITLQWVTFQEGNFWMGSSDGDENEKPARRVAVSPFSLTKTEVTVGQYAACVKAGSCTEPAEGRQCNWYQPGRDTYPINCITWNQAAAFCHWVGARLPSEAEWEFAARSGGRDQRFPWGNSDEGCKRAISRSDDGDGCGKDTTWPVCSSTGGNSDQGLCDLSGNVSEWVEDCYHESYTGAPMDSRAWVNPDTFARVLRGGGWMSPPSALRASGRMFASPPSRDFGWGARCARTP